MCVDLCCPLEMEAKQSRECAGPSEFEAQDDKSGSTAIKQRQSMAPPFPSKHTAKLLPCPALLCGFSFCGLLYEPVWWAVLGGAYENSLSGVALM